MMTLSEEQFRKLSRADVLRLPMQAAIDYFKFIQVKHKNLEVIASDLAGMLSPSNEINVIALIGATGVGKTTLSKRLLKTLVQNLAGSATGKAPFIFIAAPANGDKSLSWTTLYSKVMKAGNEPLIDKKHSTIVVDGTISLRPKTHKTLAALREALESMLRNRGVRVLVIDEAVHLLRFGEYSSVMDTIKSLADETGCKIVLVGSYDLFALVSNYGQVARRAQILHFARYRAHRKDHVKEFGEVVKKLQALWPCQVVPNIEAISDDLMEASLGCVGMLKALLLHAVELQLRANGKWSPTFLQKAAKSVKLLDVIREEIMLGEEQLEGATYGESLFSGSRLDQMSTKMAARTNV